MTRFHFRAVDGKDTSPQEWLRYWATQYPTDKYEAEHDKLVSKDSVTGEDFERIGRWKDAAHTPGKWKPNVASVAYLIWMQAVSQCPRCPDDSHVVEFLNDWSERRYPETNKSRTFEKPFGLSRATTLLYFLSRQRYPIFDARVRRAMTRLLMSPVLNTIEWYLASYCPRFAEITALCAAENVRAVDKALFAYGDKSLTVLDGLP
jgi:hypothetical protein